ncbi:MAG: hypothetical protein HPY54_08475 [Chthonomonadetes bacterium]|nr:hypothetical protein [Chthonomonadetes bacterium]
MSNGTLYRAGVIGLLLAVGWLVGCGRERHAVKPPPSERLLFSFERRTMLPLYEGTASRAIVSEHATHGKHALRLKLSPKRETIILPMGGFPSDWRGWRTLKVDVYRDGGPLTVNLRISDAHGKRHWIWSTRISPGANTLAYDIPSLQGRVDLSAVAELMWYAEQPEGVIYLDNVRLSR